MFKVIGNSKELYKFDYHHLKFKNHKSESSRKICNTLLPQLQNSVQKIYNESKYKIEKLEKEYFLKHGNVLTSEDLSLRYKETYLKFVNSKKLIQTWKL